MWNGIKRKRTSLKAVRPIVNEILRDNVLARSDDHYLYSEVVRKVSPQLLYAPFYIAINDDNMPSMESVRRSRQWLQHHYEELRPDDDVIAGRELNEERYKEFNQHG